MKLVTRYNGRIDLDLYKEYCVKSIFKILPLMEEEKDWKKYLKGFLVELNGINNLVYDINYTCLLGKLQGLLEMNEKPEDRELFKKIVFDSIDLAKNISPSKEGEE